MRFRAKPVEILAVQIPLTKGPGTHTHVVDFLLDGCEEWEVREDGSVLVGTLEGVMRGDPGDWIIKGLLGEFYPCKPEAFSRKYEAVESAAGEGQG